MELMTLAEAREQIQDLKEQTFVGAFKDFKYDQALSFTSDKVDYSVSDSALRRLCSLMGVTKTTFNNVSENLRVMIINELLKAQHESVRFIAHDGVIQNYVDSSYPYVNNTDIFSSCVSALEQYEPQVEFNINGSSSFSFVTTEETPLRKGDIARAGIAVDSYVDKVLQKPVISVAPFCYRMVCSNGMIGQSDQVAYRKANSQEELQGLLDNLISNMYKDSSKTLVPAFASTVDIDVIDPASVIHRLSKEYGIGKAKGVLLDRVVEIGESPTMFDVINFITSQANEFDFKDRRRLQGFGGYAALTSEHRCDSCHQKL